MPSSAPIDLAAATLAAPPPPDEERSVRRLVADSARTTLGGELPADYLDEAVRLAKQGIDGQPKMQGMVFARREAMRRRLGELGSPWEIVVQIRTSSQKSFDLGYLEDERRGKNVSTTPLDVDQAIQPHKSEDAIHVRSGVAPAGQTAVLESVEIHGHFGAPSQRDGRVSVSFGNASLPEIRGRGPTRVRLEGTRQAHRFTGFGGGDARIDVYYAAVEVVFKGRWSPQTSDARVEEKPFRAMLVEGDGFIRPGPIRIQVWADHGGGNPHTAFLDGTNNGYIRAIADRPVWDDLVELRKARQSSTFGSNVGVVPPGKVLRIRRIDWRARFGEFTTNSQFAVQAGGTQIVALKGPELVSDEEQKARVKAGSATEEFRSGTWTGELLVRSGEESRTSLNCSYYVLGEAVFDGELIDDPK